MLTLTHSTAAGTELECPHPRDQVAPVLRPIGWRPRPDGRWRLPGTAGQPADPRRIALTTAALRRRGFTVTTPPVRTPARRAPRPRH
ncbi:hypothetical protein [Streptacidiphilus monticola]|uniref:Uncharacterized protein n=1 Tax=Streptacidiphilus monticola TaxID=2161674 RepID=A0ABW1GCA2_9ACTN